MGIYHDTYIGCLAAGYSEEYAKDAAEKAFNIRYPSGRYAMKPRIIVSSPLGFPGCTIQFQEIPFPSDLSGMTSYVGHPATRALVEALGAMTDTSGRDNAPGRWNGPEIGESYIAVPLASNAREGGWTNDVAVTSVSQLKAVLCTRLRDYNAMQDE